MFRARLLSIFTTYFKLQCLPRNLHLVTTLRSPDNGISHKHATRHVWSAAPATQNDDGSLQSAAPATKTATHLLKTKQSTQNDFRHVMKHVGMSQRAMRATRNEASQRLKPPKISKNDSLCRTRHRHGHSDLLADGCRQLQTVANGCRRLRWQKRRQANTSPPPDPQSKSRTLRYAFGKKLYNDITHYIIQDDRNRHASTHPSIYPSIFPSIYLSICIFIIHNIHNMTLQCIALLCISLHHIPYRQAERERETERERESTRERESAYILVSTMVFCLFQFSCGRATAHAKIQKTGFYLMTLRWVAPRLSSYLGSEPGGALGVVVLIA